MLNAFKLPEYTAAARLALDGASFQAENRSAEGSYKPLSKYPSTDQDITLKVAREITFKEVHELIAAELQKTNYQWNVEPLSIFQEEAAQTKNMSFRITISDYSRTLSKADLTEVIEAIASSAHQQLKAEQV